MRGWEGRIPWIIRVHGRSITSTFADISMIKSFRCLGSVEWLLLKEKKEANITSSYYVNLIWNPGEMSNISAPLLDNYETMQNV
jgi:hypothetical protein